MWEALNARAELLQQRARALWRDNPDLVVGLKHGLLLGVAAAMLVLPPARQLQFSSAVAAAPTSDAPRSPRRADFADEQPSDDARIVADWVTASRDNRQLAFAVLDKRGARLYVFDRDARLLGSSMVLLGSATGDDTPSGVGNKPLAALRPDERVTAAGRFVSEPGHDDAGDEVVWVDYDAAVAMHRVRVVDPKERRFERIATPTAHDKRISNGCINVPIAFFDQVVMPALGAAHAVIYVLPDLKPLRQVFPAADAAARRPSDVTS